MFSPIHTSTPKHQPSGDEVQLQVSVYNIRLSHSGKVYFCNVYLHYAIDPSTVFQLFTWTLQLAKLR